MHSSEDLSDIVVDRLGQKHSGTLLGLIDAPAQISSIIFVSLFPRLLERGGWPAMFRMCAGCSVGGLGFVWCFLRMEARNPSADLQLP